MKILCISDQIDPLVYTPAIKARFSDVDLILFAGDLRASYIDFVVSMLNRPAFFVFGNHDLTDFDLYHKIPQKKNGAHPFRTKKDIGFFSTHNAGFSSGATYVGFKVLKEKRIQIPHPKSKKPTPLLLAGVSGTLRYNNGLDQYTNRQMFFHLLKLLPRLILNKICYGRACDIFLTHASPRHIHDLEDPCHRGFECFNWFIKKIRPKYFVHGHIHLYDLNAVRVTKIFDTTVINAFSHFTFEFGD